jgi:hypothetical protein
MEKKQLAYAEMVKDGTYQVKVRLAGHALPHVFPDVFSSEEDANLWIRSNAGQDRIHEIRNKYNKWKARKGVSIICKNGHNVGHFRCDVPEDCTITGDHFEFLSTHPPSDNGYECPQCNEVVARRTESGWKVRGASGWIF